LYCESSFLCMLHCRQSRRLCVFIVCSLGPEICFSTQLVTSSNSFFEGFVICTEPLLRDGSLCNNLPSGLEKQPERVIVKRGEPLLLNCILNRFFALDSRELPQKNITWIKNGLPIESKSILGHTISYSNGSLFVPHTISLASSDDGADDGFYFCIVNYLSETFISSGTHVTVAGNFAHEVVLMCFVYVACILVGHTKQFWSELYKITVGRGIG